MGENKHIKELDAFAKKYVKEVPKEQPSIDFTSNLMQKIALEETVHVIKTKSLISKKGWFGIVILMIGTLFLAFSNTEESSLKIPELKLSLFNKIELPSVIEGISLSNTTIYAFVLFGVMMAFQFTYLKQYFDKRIS